MKHYKQKTDLEALRPNPVSAADALMDARAIVICSEPHFVDVNSFIRSLSEVSPLVPTRITRLTTLILILWAMQWGPKE
jgi:hypothetical protein